MIVTVVGKARFNGVSRKNGRAYDFIQLHYVAPADRVEGNAAVVGSMDPTLYPYSDIQPGFQYDVQYDRAGRIVGFASA